MNAARTLVFYFPRGNETEKICAAQERFGNSQYSQKDGAHSCFSSLCPAGVAFLASRSCRETAYDLRSSPANLFHCMFSRYITLHILHDVGKSLDYLAVNYSYTSLFFSASDSQQLYILFCFTSVNLMSTPMSHFPRASWKLCGSQGGCSSLLTS